MSVVVTTPTSFRTALQQHQDRRLWYIFVLGCSSGFPWVLISSAMSGWLKDANLSRAAIGYFGSVTAVYALNFLWAPLVDRLHLPLLTRTLGQRRSWVMSMQSLIALLTVAMAFTNPANSIIWMSLLAFLIGLFGMHENIIQQTTNLDFE